MRPLIFSLLVLAIQSISESSYAAVFSRLDIWNKSKIEVCFYNPINSTFYHPTKKSKKLDGSAAILVRPTEELKLFSKQILQQNYSREETIIEFVGWKDCDVTTKYDVILVFSDEPLGSGESNMYSDFDRMHLNYLTTTIGLGTVNAENLSLTPEMKHVLIHEFGHLAGLGHEHEFFIKSALSDPQCEHLYEYLQSFKKYEEAMWDLFPEYKRYKTKRKSITGYDSNSVMTYCKKSDQLSEFDKITLRYMYRKH